MIKCCGDRQHECDGLKKWPLNFFIKSLPVMLQVTLLLACGLYQHMWSINSSVVFTLISLTGLRVAFYIVIVITRMSSFQTPASTALCGLWKKARRVIVSLTVRHPRVLLRSRQNPSITLCAEPVHSVLLSSAETSGRTGLKSRISAASINLSTKGTLQRAPWDSALQLTPSGVIGVLYMQSSGL